MRRIVFIGLALALNGCGFNAWWTPPFVGNSNPNLPVSDSENMQRVLGARTSVEPMTTEPGDIWPGQLPPAPTLKDLEQSSGLSAQPEAPVPGSPLSRGLTGPLPAPNPTSGSSTSPGSNAPGLPPLRTAPPLSSYSAPAASPPSNGSTGQVMQTPSGPSVITGGGPGYQTTTSPGGGQSIVVPNGNGTSTVIHADGRIETIPTPK